MDKTTEAFDAWWSDTGEQSLFALNTTTDDDIKILAGIAWEAAIREVLADHIADAGKVIAETVKQEPVAWWELNEDIGAWFLAYTFNPKAKTRPLIFGDAAPVSAKREWVELTDDEGLELAKRSVGKSRHWLVAEVIATFKEKNK